jgi:4-diphosphocytidyl-2-C-methyl-D-erythritol kinase
VSAAPVPHSVTIEARAKLNLGLAVGPKRDDGFHELATFFQSVSLADTLTVRRHRAGFTLRVRFESAAARGATPRPARGDVPAGADNLVLRAARLLATRYGIAGGAHFELVKRIPSRAGMGGGSADAAAALMGFAAVYGLVLGRAERLALACELGSDVPFAVFGGTALGRGRGEQLASLRLAKPFRALVAVPEWGVSTAEAFRAIDRRRKHLTEWSAILRSAQILGRERLRADRAMRLGNTFESALGERRKEFNALVGRLEDVGASFVRMTGSGSAVVGLLPDGRAGAGAVRRFQGTETLYLVRSMGRGLKLIGRS